MRKPVVSCTQRTIFAPPCQMLLVRRDVCPDAFVFVRVCGAYGIMGEIKSMGTEWLGNHTNRFP